MNYLTYLNKVLIEETDRHTHVVVFGQNIAAGSFLGGLTKGLKVKAGGRIINTINAENSLVGFGFGLALSGANAIFFMRQIDFLLLTTDQLVNTYNSIRNNPAGLKGSFTIMTTVIDQGYEGPQSSLNNLGDFCSLAHIDAFTVTNKTDIEEILSTKLIAPGFRIIAASPRLYKTEIINPGKPVYRSDSLDLYQYSRGNDTTIVCFNLAFPHGFALNEEIKRQGGGADLFNVISPNPIDWRRIIGSVERTRKIVIIDDSKSLNHSFYSLLSAVKSVIKLKKEMVIERHFSERWLTPHPDQLVVEYERITKDILI